MTSMRGLRCKNALAVLALTLHPQTAESQSKRSGNRQPKC
jgi:hypothetical protein